MVAFSHRELSDPALLDLLFTRLPPEYRSALRRAAYREEPIDDAEPLLQGLERIDDGARGRRMRQLVQSGMLVYTAARQACIEDPRGASDDACTKHLVRKYKAARFL